ncbi:MAG: hypothetical protein ACRDHZ_23855 [Ktedonobacteraceae bacterium]
MGTRRERVLVSNLGSSSSVGRAGVSAAHDISGLPPFGAISDAAAHVDRSTGNVDRPPRLAARKG